MLQQSWNRSRWSRVCLQMPTDILKLSMEGKTGSLCSEGSLPCSSRFDDGTRGWGHSSPKLTWMPQHRSAFSVKRWWTISSATRIPSADSTRPQYAVQGGRCVASQRLFSDRTGSGRLYCDALEDSAKKDYWNILARRHLLLGCLPRSHAGGHQADCGSAA